MKKRPGEFPLHDKEYLMSNFDHSIDQEVAKDIKAYQQHAYYAAWNFHGQVWWDGEWNCQIKQHGVHVGTASSDTLEELMEKCCNTYGHD